MMRERVSTGIEAIDRELAGGVEPGSLVAVVAGPAMQSEALLRQMAGTQQTLYLTTLRDPVAVEQTFDADADIFVKDVRSRRSMENEFLENAPGSKSYWLSFDNSDSVLDTVYETVRKIDRQLNVVVDPTNPLEEADNRDAYSEVLNELKSRLLDTGGLGVLHCVTLEEQPTLRDVTLTICDVVIELELASLNRRQEYQLRIPKNRGGTPLLEDTTLVIDAEVWIDESRNI